MGANAQVALEFVQYILQCLRVENSRDISMSKAELSPSARSPVMPLMSTKSVSILTKIRLVNSINSFVYSRGLCHPGIDLHRPL
jgi:hypothetical protein